jgi:acetylglutamate kinase
MAAKSSVIPSDIVLTLVESVGRREDAEFYLRLFRELPKHSFAIVAPDAPSLSEHPGRIVEDLRVLAHLGLFAPVVLGLFQPVEAEAQADALSAQLSAARLKSRRYAAHAPRLLERLKLDLEESRVPVVSFSERTPTLFSRFSQIGEWVRWLGVRKLVLVRARGGIGPHLTGNIELGLDHQLLATERGISLINLRRDLAALLSSKVLEEEERELLSGVGEAMQLQEPGAEQRPGSIPEGLVTSVTAPSNLLHELFTVKGAGTLIRHGSRIDFHPSYASLDRERLGALLEATFGHQLKSTFFEREPTGIYLEQTYRGAAIVSAANGATYLTKFVVDRLAQGLGIGRDLWEVVTRDHERLFWRARPLNPITQWYQSQCHGMVRTERWNIYWRGVAHENIPSLIQQALALPPDFES